LGIIGTDDASDAKLATRLVGQWEHDHIKWPMYESREVCRPLRASRASGSVVDAWVSLVRRCP